MRINGLLQALLAAQAAAVAVPADKNAQRSSGKLTDTEILQGFLENPHLLPKSAYEVIKHKVEERAHQLSKRDPQVFDMSVASWVGVLGVTGAMIQSWFPLPKNAPVSKVKETADTMSEKFAGALRRKIRYGPYRIPPTSEKNLESEFLHTPGMGNTFKYNARKPCENECTVLSLEMSLEFDDGAPAENGNGAWFHHATLVNAGPNAKTPICGNTAMENIAMAGNEKSSVLFSIPDPNAVKAGYHLSKSDSFTLSTQLMNMENKEKFVWITVTYDYLDGPRPDYLQGRFIWQSISANTAGACTGNAINPFGASNLTENLQPKSLKFSEHSPPIEAQIDGLILATGGHMHDGGTGIDTVLNDKVICTSEASYKKDAQGMGGHGHKRRDVNGGYHSLNSRQIAGAATGNNEIEHISGQTRCSFAQGIKVSPKDRIFIRANYDFNLHPGMKNAKGELDEVMGIVGTLVAMKA